ncbi:histone acetyltransferase KAT7 isoform X1 [Hydra vulgaris]|uniref:Histone acetyltransferase n=1 Tax=Hydra vulgaris TaxID=6087 RepID=T2MHS5_HYDVU|nr:histone acetyltransferase KAT7 [Hydra vulgaris]
MSCKFCEADSNEEQIQCATCKGMCHPSCLELPKHIIPVVRTYDWQCNDCKYCYGCHDIENEKQILFCDRCDRGYHMYCIKPKMKKKPKGDWFCPVCTSENVIIKTGLKRGRPLKDKSLSNQFKPQNINGNDLTNQFKSDNINGSDLTIETVTQPQHTNLNDTTQKYDNSDLQIIRETDSCDDSPPEKVVKESVSETTDSQVKSSKITPEIPVEHIVSKTDINLFEAAKKKMEILLAIDKDMSPQEDGIKTIRMGDLEMEAWYKSQYPLEFNKCSKLHICEFCFDYSKTETIYKRHMAKCSFRNPPGEEIYRKDKLSVFEVDGQKATKYCQNLCLLAKLFLDHKTLWMDVGPFLFYIMTFNDETGCHIIGYFSKEKVSFLNYNVSCILIMPNYMKKGYGQMLIEFSYLLSQKEGKTGSPERPLSDLGLMSYRKYWEEKLLQYLLEYSEDQITIKGLSEIMSIHPSDIVSTLQFLGMLKYWKGKHLILLRKEIIDEYTTKAKSRENKDRVIDPVCLVWTPKVFK